MLRSPSTGETSRPDESERDFRARLQQASRESRDRALDALRRKYAPGRPHSTRSCAARSRRWSGSRSRPPARSCRR